MRCLLLRPAPPLCYFDRWAFSFRPSAHNLNNFPDISTFAFCSTGGENIPFVAIAGTVRITCFTFRKYRTVVKILEQTCRNRNCGLAYQMIEEKITQLKICKINLITHEIKLIVRQEFFAGKPGVIAAGTFFEYGHNYTVTSNKQAT